MAILDPEVGDTAQALADKVLHACLLVTDDAPLRGHTWWEVRTLLKALRPSQLTDREMMALAVTLAGANARASAPPSPTLRLVEVGEDIVVGL